MHCRLTLFASVFALLSVGGALSIADPSELAGKVLSYRLEPKEPLKYRLVANLKGKLPIGDSPEPADITAKLSLTYTAVPKTRLTDGTSDVDFQVADVDFEVMKLPFVVPDDQARDILNLRVTLSKTGEVVKVYARDKEMPFSVSVPGVDPKRLYALLFPIVFRSVPVREGESWDYKSELLGGQGTAPRFTATLLPAASKTSNKLVKLKQEFEMPVDVKKNADKKPVTNDEEAHRAQTGKIDGDGVFVFDAQKGRVTHGDVNIRANIKDSLVGKPESDDEPKEIDTAIQAKVTIDLLNGAPSKTRGEKPAGVQRGATNGKAVSKEKP